MDPESKKLLEDTFVLAQENNKMLHSVMRSMRISRIISIVYWVLIIGSALGAYYFIQPYINQLISIYGGAKSNLGNFGTVSFMWENASSGPKPLSTSCYFSTSFSTFFLTTTT